MTQEQFNEVKERLAKWRKERHLTYENQREEFLGNVFEKISKYFRAKDDCEIVNALCDMAAFCFNVNDVKFSNYECYMKSDKVDFKFFDIVSQINYIVIYKADFERDPVKVILDTLIALLHKKCESLKFNFYKCMLETIKEIESRTGYYDEGLNKFTKDKGVYNTKEAYDKFLKENISDDFYVLEDNEEFVIFDKENDFALDKFKKWYKADYESCRI
ncbi:hypothetical protein KBI89_01670 [Campylobacter coli]|uniref:hypothetical protein n=1 Tax=Campylobacter coli TaxID=195 RepID=UPI00127BA074|nr:hypothetical protein [Campylobacter coli]EAK0311101.1 hypothetical protein [Campylobacter coli]EAK7356395.1 hypothetical protein [Campylobacter coli]ECC0590699.1 hypothetical protein [Campylobacter coli]ECC0667330.1 hypothetical protein [Campylobacter coli]EDO6855460.1 hypothetical protein [Campylobacter coli]